VSPLHKDTAECRGRDKDRDRSVKKLGKGLDVGTANLVCAYHGEDGKTNLRRERNAFLDVKIDAFHPRHAQ
jgi:hypothetical protein